MSHAHVIVQRVPVSLPWAWNQPSHVHNNKTLQSTGAGATAQRPMLRCWVLPQPSEPKWPAGVRRTLQQNVSTRMFPWTSCLVAPALLTPTQHLSVLHIDSTKTSLKKTTWFWGIWHIVSCISYHIVSYLQTPKKICPFPTASEHCPHLHCQLFL